ncbi:MAG: exo-beta-N-acetylmuramidase NamZ family protein [Gemmatimonadaceae bacterium]
MILPILILLALTGCAPSGAAAPATVRTGVDMLATDMPAVLAGKRVGLVTNHTGMDATGRSTIDVMAADDRFELVALYGPEHGLRGTAAPGEKVDSGRDSATGLPIHSLYGATRKPTAAMLEGVEALVFDIQDVGSRTYTYVYTMALAMEAARDAGIPFVVLDRPNPIGGTIVEGNLLDTAYASFVGMYPMPVRHGMTVGELARLFNDSFGIGAALTVVPMQGWKRDMWFDETGLPWTPPSPNIPRLSSAISYPGTVFFEGINLSEGRGTDHPFEQTGASWLRSDSVVAAMQALGLPGVRFEAVTITASAKAQVFPGQTFPGVRLVITDRESYRPLDAALRLIDTIRRLHPEEFRFTGNTAGQPDMYWIDRLAGTDKLRRAMEQGTLDALLADWSRQASEFERSRARFLLY